MTLDAPTPPISTMRRDLVSAYVASGMKVLSWAVVSALLFRTLRFDHFAVFVLARSTVGLLNYTTVGLAPAIIAKLSRAVRVQTVQRVDDSTVLNYAGPPAPDVQAVMVSALRLAVLSAVVGAALAWLYANNFNRLHDIHGPIARQIGPTIALAMGLGVAVRLASDAIGAMLQAHQRIAADNYALASAEVVWMVMAALRMHGGRGAVDAAWCFLLAAMVLLLIRWRLLMATRSLDLTTSGPVDWGMTWELLAFGVLVTLAQLADFLYAPMDFFLIGRLLGLADLANYAPAVQIDAALLMIVTGMAGVLLPKSAIAHAGGDQATLRKYFLRGTLASMVMLAVAGLATWLASPWIFPLWLGNDMPATRAILPLVLIHTVVGGSSAVGRSILLGMGKVRPFTLAVVIAGVSNVALSYCFVRYAGLGLNGIVLGTICAVVGRCAIWQPWYVWRALRSPETRNPRPETR